TRYAPGRRSQVSKLTLPLDLHVLGLPLAFIQSQDQTLHRILLICIDKDTQGYFNLIRLSLTLVLCCQFNMSMNFVFFIYALISQRGSKSTNFIFISRTLLNIFLISFLSKDRFISLNFLD